MTDQLKEKLAHLPHRPGVYHYYDHQGKLLYVGKAKDLFKRVHSYWQKTNLSPWTQLLVSEIADIKVVEVQSELEALLLENSLIKSLKPKYNLQLRDDKTFPFLRISNEALPTFTVVRKVRHDKARYIGPYLSATYLRTMLKIVQELYGIKTASEKSYEARSSVPQQIGLGARHLDDPTLYQQKVDDAVRFLSSPQPAMERLIKEQMQTAAEQEQFERAAVLRDRFQSLQQLRTAQSLFSASQTNRDYVGYVQVGTTVSVYILVERDGKMVDHKEFLFTLPVALQPDELTDALLEYLYVNGIAVPKTILVPELPQEVESMRADLKEQTGHVVEIMVPKRGELKDRLATAIDNARYQLRLESMKKQRREEGVGSLAQLLGLKTIPRRIEAFDISNLGSTNIVGASIVFIDGQPAKNEYRKYKIETPEGQDDFASMRELVFRRVSNKQRPLPDLLLIDGGKGQLSAALDALALAKVEVPLISLAKKEELIFRPHESEPLVLPLDSPALLLLTMIRDEVHRFVITFHRARRNKTLLPPK